MISWWLRAFCLPNNGQKNPSKIACAGSELFGTIGVMEKDGMKAAGHIGPGDSEKAAKDTFRIDPNPPYEYILVKLKLMCQPSGGDSKNEA